MSNNIQTVKVEIKNLDEYIELLHQLKDIVKKINDTNLEIELKKLCNKNDEIKVESLI